MLSKLKAWFRAHRLNRAIQSRDTDLSNVLLATSIQREAHEQYNLGECTCNVMRDEAEMKERVSRVNKIDLAYEAVKVGKAQRVWLET